MIDCILRIPVEDSRHGPNTREKNRCVLLLPRKGDALNKVGLLAYKVVLLGREQLKGMFRNVERGRRDGSAVSSTGCPSREPGFNSQYPHSSACPRFPAE